MADDPKPLSKSSATARRPLPSAHDVARLAGVSQAAVSRAFDPKASISEATRSKVLNAARELKYRPNLLARSLITGRSRIIGVVIGNPRNTFFLEALDALSEELSQAGLHLLVFTARVDSNADQLVEALLRFRVESLLMMSATLSPELAEQCRAEGISIIYFHRRSTMLDGCASVTGANFLGAGVVAEHLIDQGYRNPAFMAGFETSSTSQEREAGFMAKIALHNLPQPAKAFGHFDRPGALIAARQLLSLNPRPDSIYCANDMMAMTTIEVARKEFGLTIGRDLGVAGFDDTEGASWYSFDLTTYSQPVDRMIKKVTELILDETALFEKPHVVVEGELKVRSSTKRT
jgi:DNA-binding LacI/PurR family transcriptional regulator